MAELFLAQDMELEQLAVIKRILPYLSQEAEFVQMFLDEARIASQLHHPNIIQVFELGKQQDSIFIAMEFVEGVDVRKLLQEESKRGQTMPYEVVAFIMAEVCAGLSYAHNSHGVDGRALEVVHRDVSPQNVMVSFSGEIKLVDFGIAKAGALVERSKPGVIKGKFLYLSPEQLSQERLDQRADLFALGTMLYELTLGRAPFYKPTTEAVIYAIRNEDPVPPVQARPDFPPELSRIIMKCLVKDRNRRYQHAVEIQRDLEAFLRSRSFSRYDLVTYVDILFGNEDERTKVHIPGSVAVEALAWREPPPQALPVGRRNTQEEAAAGELSREPITNPERTAERERLEPGARAGFVAPPVRRPSGGRYTSVGEVVGEPTVTTPRGVAEAQEVDEEEVEPDTLSQPVRMPPPSAWPPPPPRGITDPGEPTFERLRDLPVPGPSGGAADYSMPMGSLSGGITEPDDEEGDEGSPTLTLPKRALRRERQEPDEAEEDEGDEEALASQRSPWVFGAAAFFVVLLFGALGIWLFRMGTSEPSEAISPPLVIRVEPKPPKPDGAPREAPDAGAVVAKVEPAVKELPPDPLPPDPLPPRPALVTVIFRGPRGTLVKRQGARYRLDEPYRFPPGPLSYAYQCPWQRRLASGMTNLEAPDTATSITVPLCRSRR